MIETLIENTRDIDEEIQEVINTKFWELLCDGNMTKAKEKVSKQI